MTLFAQVCQLLTLVLALLKQRAYISDWAVDVFFLGVGDYELFSVDDSLSDKKSNLKNPMRTKCFKRNHPNIYTLHMKYFFANDLFFIKINLDSSDNLAIDLQVYQTINRIPGGSNFNQNLHKVVYLGDMHLV